MSYDICQFFNNQKNKCAKPKCPYHENPETCSGMRYSPYADGFCYNAKTKTWYDPGELEPSSEDPYDI